VGESSGLGEEPVTPPAVGDDRVAGLIVGFHEDGVLGTGSVPFGLSFDRDANLLVAGAAGVASSYSVHRDGALTGISIAVPNGQSATSWTVFARGNLYAANAGSATITGYTDRRGTLALRESTGVTAHTETGPVDLRRVRRRQVPLPTGDRCRCDR